MLVVTSSLLLLLSTINIHSVSGKATKVAQRGLGCKTNGLARTFAQKLNQNLSKQRIKGRNGKIRGESESRMGQMAAAFAKFDRKLNEMETQGVCLGDQSSHGGAELEAQLEKAIDIMHAMRLSNGRSAPANIHQQQHKAYFEQNRGTTYGEVMCDMSKHEVREIAEIIGQVEGDTRELMGFPPGQAGGCFAAPPADVRLAPL